MLKALIEKRNALIIEMEELLSTAKTETRAFNKDELSRFEVIKSEVKNIDETIKADEEIRNLEPKQPSKTNQETEQRALDEQNFLSFVRGEQRALGQATSGGIVPKTIASQIIETVKELSPIYSLATVYNVKGQLVFPVYDEKTSSIGAAYQGAEFTELTEGTGKFTTVELNDYVIGVLAKVSKSLMNNTDVDLLSFIVNKVAQAIADFLEKELILGTVGKMSGISSTTNTVTSATTGKVDLDDLIDLQDAVPEVYQTNAIWIMNKATRKAFRKLKDADGQYILNKDATTAFGWSMFGKPVYITSSAPVVAAGNKAVFYGDMSGIVVKLSKDVEVNVLTEKYSNEYAIGVNAFVQADSKVVDHQKIATLVVKSA